MTNGYALATGPGLEAISRHIRNASPAEVDALRAALRIGVHWDVEVTDGREAERPTVSQAFCSALPVAYSALPGIAWEPFARVVLEAAYEATLWAAVANAQRGTSNVIFLTLLGGGAFGNPTGWILEAIHRALETVSDVDLDVRIVSFGDPPAGVMRLAGQFR
jgi:hypothetical protein